MSYDLMSGYYHVDLHPRSRTFVRFCWKGQYYVYRCLPFGLSTTPWVFSKVMMEMIMYWRREGINVLPYLEFHWPVDWKLISSGRGCGSTCLSAI